MRGRLINRIGDDAEILQKDFRMIPFAQTISTLPTNGTNAVHRMTIGGAPTSGTFRLTWNGRTSTAITYSNTNATLLANIQTALDTIFGAGNTIATAATLTAGVGTIDITFAAAFGKTPQSVVISYTASTLNGSGTIAIASQTAGVAASYRGAAPGAMLIYTGVVPAVQYYNASATLHAPNWQLTGGIVTAALGSPALASVTAIHAAVTDNGAPQTITTAITNPVVPRVVTATAGGTAGDIKAIQVTINGTDINGEVLTEDLPAFTVNTTGTVTGTKAFKTVTSVVIPAHDGVGATTSIGTGPALGLPIKLSRNTTVNVYLGGVKDSFAGMTFSSTVVASNTVTLTSALDGSAVLVDYYKS
jgi:hypothetical protein